jgi:hypothetical protein
MMPDLLRETGSFGTHWMLQDRILVSHLDDKLTISGKEVINVIRSLHVPEMAAKLTDDGSTVLCWSLEDKGHGDGWGTVIGSKPPLPPGCKAPSSSQ